MHAEGENRDGDSVMEEKIAICSTCLNVVRLDQIKEKNGMVGCIYCIA